MVEEEGDSGHLTGHEADVRCETSRERWGILAANFQDKTPLFDRLGLTGRLFT
ncbi:MAG: hypothetical protein ACREKS_08830 [Candidatus Rokuibacteriota bacterium]